MAVFILSALISVIMLIVVGLFGCYVGHKATIEFLKFRQELPSCWPSLEDDWGERELLNCDECQTTSDSVMHCMIKENEYLLCENCMVILNAKPFIE